LPPRDLVLRPINIRELMVDPSASEAFGVLDPITSKVHDAEQHSLLAARATRDQPIKKRVVDKYMHGLISLIGDQDGPSEDQLLALFEEHNGPVESDEARVAILSQLRPLATALAGLRLARRAPDATDHAADVS
jgi:hypothetical protein